MTSEPYRPLPIEPRGKTARLWLLIAASAKIGSLLVFATGVVATLPGTPISFALLRIAAPAGLIFAIAFYVAALFVAPWIYRAAANAKAMSRTVPISPFRAVGWYFVPFANFVMPFEAMDMIWRASHQPEDWEGAPTSGLLRLWWAGWLTSLLLGTFAMLLASTAADIPALGLAHGIGLVSALCAIAAAIAFRRIIGRISHVQARHQAAQVF